MDYRSIPMKTLLLVHISGLFELHRHAVESPSHINKQSSTFLRLCTYRKWKDPFVVVKTNQCFIANTSEKWVTVKEKSYTYTKACIVKTVHEEPNDVSFLSVTLWRSCGEHGVKKTEFKPKNELTIRDPCVGLHRVLFLLGLAGEQVWDNRLKWSCQTAHSQCHSDAFTPFTFLTN